MSVETRQSWKMVDRFLQKLSGQDASSVHGIRNLVAYIHETQLDDVFFGNTSHYALVISRVPIVGVNTTACCIRVEQIGSELHFELFDKSVGKFETIGIVPESGGSEILRRNLAQL